MNVLERIDRGELVLCEWFDGKLGPGRWSIVEPQQAELLRLARLGAAAEMYVDDCGVCGGKYQSEMCISFIKNFNVCYQEWFCRIRAEKGTG